MLYQLIIIILSDNLVNILRRFNTHYSFYYWGQSTSVKHPIVLGHKDCENCYFYNTISSVVARTFQILTIRAATVNISRLPNLDVDVQQPLTFMPWDVTN